MKDYTTSIETDPLCDNCGRPVKYGGIYIHHGIYHPECVGNAYRNYQMNDQGPCPFCNGTGRNFPPRIPCNETIFNIKNNLIDETIVNQETHTSLGSIE